jgi:tRNA uridine 5-carbamoylmethylation protein Kti12
MKNELIVVIGAYGSGKSEYAINLARQYRADKKPVTLVDMDVVNPYFRSRDVQEKFAEIGIEVIAPEGEFKHADLPMMSPRIMGAVQNNDSVVILDVGGDPAGCRTMARYIDNIKKRGYQMHFVVNTKRPFTSGVKEINEMIEMLQSASKLQITELICNTNLMQYTDAEIVENGIKICQAAISEREIKFEKYLVLDENADKIPAALQGKQKVVLSYFLNKPWQNTVVTNSSI